MKKLIVLLLALTVVGLAVAAQDTMAPTLKWSGYLNTGFLYEQVGSADATMVQAGQDSGHAARFNVGGTYTNGDYGVTFRLRMQDDISASKPVEFLNRGYGWMKFFGGMVKVQAGKLGDYTWSSANGYNNAFGNFDTLAGLQLQIMPMDGLNFGGFIPLAVTPATAEYVFDTGAIGMAYTMKDMFDVQLGYQSNDNAKKASVWFGGDLYAVKNLAFELEGQLGNLGDSNAGTTYVYFDSTYTMDALGVGLTFAYESFAASTDLTQIFVDPYVTYTMGNTTFGIGVEYGSSNSKSGMEIDPNVKFTVSGNSSLKIGAYLKSGDYALSNAVGAWDPLTDNTTDIYADFIFNF